MIISGESSPDVLTDDGMVNYARAIGLYVSSVLLACSGVCVWAWGNISSEILSHSSEECFGIHLGNPFSVNLGDGNGWVNQTIELRQDYGSSTIGTCLESLIGGNHFRWVHV